MGIKTIILLALLIGVLYCIHLLVQDYQAVTAAKLLRFLFKRDTTSQDIARPHVRWRKILHYDPIQCARLFYCGLGAQRTDTEIRRGFIFMLTLNPHDEDEAALQVFKKAYQSGRMASEDVCRKIYSLCPFPTTALLQLVQYLLQQR